VAAEIWSVTSYTELRRDALSTERWNLLHPEEKPRRSYLAECLGEAPPVIVAASDYMKALPDSISRWCGGSFLSLGTDGFGRSDTREVLRDFFEVDWRYIALAALSGLVQRGQMDRASAARAREDLGIDSGKPDPVAC
jgi:pyruvate dehydrogenase E1 component